MSKPIDQLRKDFLITVLKEWNTPDTYDKQYLEVPKTAGVYCIVVKYDPDERPVRKEILYIGCSGNLRRRWNGHEVIRNIRTSYPSASIQFYFKIVEREYEEEEAMLITVYQPLLNRVRKFK